MESIDKARMHCLWFGGDTSEDARKAYRMCNAVIWLRSFRVYDKKQGIALIRDMNLYIVRYYIEYCEHVLAFGPSDVKCIVVCLPCDCHSTPLRFCGVRIACTRRFSEPSIVSVSIRWELLLRRSRDRMKCGCCYCDCVVLDVWLF